MRYIKNSLREVDMFGKSISLFFYGKKNYNSSIGGFLTISMIVLILILSNSLLTSIIYRTEVYFTTNDQIATLPPKISFKNRFAIHIDPLSTYTHLPQKKKYFDIMFGYGTWFLNSTNQYVLETTYYNLTNCNESHFPMLSKQQFQNSGLSSSLCPYDSNLELDLQGFFNLVDKYNYIEVTFRQCISRSEEEICANSSEVEEFMKTPKGEIYLDLYIVNNVLDSGNYEKPFNPFIDKITNVIGLSTFKQLEIYMTPVTLLTDPNRSSKYFKDQIEMIQTENFMYERKFDMFYNNKPRLDNDREVYLSMYIQSSILHKIYNRSYDTFGDYCQQVGSLYSIFALFFGLLNKLIVSDDLNIKIAKSLYDFKKSTNIWAKKKSTLFIKSFHNKIKYFWDKYFQSRQKSLIIDKVITKELDLTQLLLKIREIETFKKILLTKDQRTLFNYINRPKLKSELKIQSKRDILYSKKIKKRSLTFSTNSFPMEDRRNRNDPQILIKACENLKNEEDNELNKKILKMLDEDEITSKIENKEKGMKIKSFTNSKKKVKPYFTFKLANY